MSQEFNPFEFNHTPQSRVEREVVHLSCDEGGDESSSLDETSLDEQQRLSQAELDEQEQERLRQRQEARERNPFWQFISGNWLILDGITDTYRYLMLVAAMLFLSVVSIFYSFHLAQRYTRREAQVQLLRERALEYRRLRFNSTSHTAIIKELKRRNIPVYDIQESKTIIEK